MLAALIVLWFIVLIQTFFIVTLIMAFGAQQKKLTELELRSIGFKAATIEAFSLADFNFSATQKALAAIFSALGIKTEPADKGVSISDKLKN